MSQVIFLTDGQPTSGTYQNPSAIVSNISDLNRITAEASIFTIGLGTDVDSTFLKNLAFENRGEYLYCTASNIGAVVENLMSYINYPVLREPRVVIPDFPVYDVYPLDPPALYAGKQLIISGKYTGTGSSRVILSGETSSGHAEIDMGTIDFPHETWEYPFVALMWAKQYIDYWISWMDQNGENAEIIGSVIDMSLKYGIVCRYTEYYWVPTEPSDTSGSGVDEDLGIMVAFSSIKDGLKIDFSLLVSEVVEVIYTEKKDSEGNWICLGEYDLGKSLLDTDVLYGEEYSYRFRIVMNNGSTEYSREYKTVFFVPGQIAISSMSPNPFNPSMEILISGDYNIDYTLEIYDVSGRLVRSIRSKGDRVIWKGDDDSGNILPSGVYMVKPIGVSSINRAVFIK